MSSLEVILGEPERLDRLAKDIHDHYVSSVANDPERVQKAMIVCSKREIAYNLLLRFKEHYPEWFVERKTPEGVVATPEELKKLEKMPTIAMVASVGSNDEAGMYNYLGGVKNDERSDKLDAAFKQEKSNFRIVIVVDMWITGFDVECLTYMYNDKPLQKHSLIQTISRANRKYPGKEYGLIVDYIGIRDQMMEARKMYGGDNSVALTKDDIEQATFLFRELLEVLKNLFKDYDLTPFLDVNTDPATRYILLAKAAEQVFKSTESFNTQSKDGKKTKKVGFKTYFLQYVRRMRKAYDLCQPSGELDEEESALAQCFMAIAGMVYKMNGTDAPDTDTMNRRVAKMVEEALKYNNVESILEDGEEMDIFGPEFTERLSDIKMPASKLEMLVKILRNQITEYGKTNQIASKKFQEMLEATIKEYHERRKFLSEQEAGATQEETAESIIQKATEQALNILKGMQADRESFRKLGLSFEEKAFYDILIHLRDKNNFVYGEDKEIDGIVVNEKCKSLACKIREIIDAKSSFTDWLNNDRVREQLKLDIKICLVKNGYPPQYTPEVFREVMEQVENLKENETTTTHTNVIPYVSDDDDSLPMAAEDYECYQWDRQEHCITRLFDDRETVLLGCYKDKKHFDWIQEHGIYNIRLGKRKGSMSGESEMFERASHLVLYDLKYPDKQTVYDIVSCAEMSGGQLKDIGYPTKKPGKTYMTFSLAESTVGAQSLDGKSLIEQITKFHPEHINGAPVFLELDSSEMLSIKK